MRLLLDSHVVLWALGEFDALGPTCRQRIVEASEAHFSPVTPWELGIKRAKGRIEYPEGLVDELMKCGFKELPITSTHANLAPLLPPHHRDPFDRMLIAQAQAESLTLVTADHQFVHYDVPTLDPRL
ncbi:type II toxin-antitoxin system VapC family toxin [Candidatus Poriferisocius sp.]|uniref:type II toxin-antitoxin system VapC family toxin n=1 Tax=Candidatus Poriferisocius sp. TaxID=3101276 RepID=UPI003B5BD8C0